MHLNLLAAACLVFIKHQHKKNKYGKAKKPLTRGQLAFLPT